MRVGTQDELSGKDVALLRQHLVADPSVTNEVLNAELLGGLPYHAMDACPRGRGRREVVVENHDDSFWVMQRCYA